MLNSPPGNVICGDLAQDLLAAIPNRTDVPALKVVLICAEGPDFSSGTQLGSASDVRRFHQIFYRLIDLGVPTVAMVRGRCLGAALELAAFCNFIFADGTTLLGHPAVRRGGFPTPASMILPLKLGAERASDLLLFGKTLDAAEAYRRGLVTAWAPSSQDLLALTKAWIETHLLPKSASSLRRANRAARLGFHAALNAELPALERLYLQSTAQKQAVA
jgi:cyclohexa-1,5-dienecarbonyl-CoA hydratase